MEALLPSEVARLVLGYLEEEKCTDAAKCFLESSHHLNEYRILAQKGRKYPTKVNGCSLIEVLEEYCLVHSIVQESLSSMTEQPNGGSLIDNLRYVVRHCQPVQVHINLHPQGLNTSTSKSEISDSTGSTRSRSKKTTVSQGQAVENVDRTSISQPAMNSAVKDSSAEGLVTISSTDTRITTQPPLHEPQLTTSVKTVCTQVNQDVTKYSSLSQLGFASCQNAGSSSHSDQNVLPESDSAFQVVNVDSHQEQNPLITTTQQSDTSIVLRSSQQFPSSAINTNHEVVMQTGAEYLQLEGARTQKDGPKPEEESNHFVTKCFGSSIVFLDNNGHSDPCTSKILPLSNSVQENHAYATILTPTKTQVDKRILEEATVKFKEKLLNDDVMVSKLVENINKVFTPAKESENSLAVPSESFAGFSKEPYLDDFLHEFLQFTVDNDLTVSPEGEPDVATNSPPGVKKRKSAAKKNNGNVSKLKQLCENAVSNISGEGSTPANQSLDKLINSANFTIPERGTPAKGGVDSEVMTPMTKLLKSITSPSGDLYLEPTQFANYIDLPVSAIKCKEQTVQTLQAQAQFSQPCSLPLNNIIELPRPYGPPLHIPVVNCSPTEVVAYSNQEGVSTLSTGTIEVMTQHGSFKPIVPRLKPGDGLLPVSSEQPKKKPQRAKRCTTRGGRQSSGRSRASAAKETSSAKEMAATKESAAAKEPAAAQETAVVTDTAGLVTIYGADGKEYKTVSYSGSSDLPILMSDTSDEATEVQPLESDSSAKDLPKNAHDEPSNDGLAELENAAPISADRESSVLKEEDNCLPHLNVSSNRNTPGFNGPARANEKRMSFSTPRRRLSHIRALDFNTPPKEHDQSIRRANTSPKNMSTNALSPNTTGRSIKSSVTGSLFKAPGDGSRRTSKVKAHLFKSPEYPIAFSSGFKIPSAAVTSTPCEASCSKDSESLPQPSSAWDKIGGVSLILDSAVSPVKRVEPQCKKELRSWDSDLRSLINSDPQPLPKEPQSVQPTLKHKVPSAAQRKRPRGKKTQKTEDAKSKEEGPESKKDEKVDESVVDKESFEKTHEISTASDCEMAKLLENNLMDASSGSTKKESPLKSSITTSLVNERIVEMPCVNNAIDEHESSCANPVLSETPTEENVHEDSSKALPQLDQSNSGSECNKNSVSDTGLDSVKESIPNKAQASNEVVDKKEDSITEKKVSTPVSDGLLGSAVDKFRLSQVTFKESFSFETPIKDNVFANMVPQTPCFLDPSSHSNEDTPRTKIIKSLPLPPMPSTETSESNTPTVPPTPTISTTPAGSPNGVSYFQPKQSPSRRTQIFKSSPRVKSLDNLSSILVQECSRLEASGMRELPKKCVIEPSEKSDQVHILPESEDNSVMKKNSIEEVTSAENGDQSNEIVIVPTPPVPTPLVSNETIGCARHMKYKRKPLQRQMSKLIIDALSEPSRRRNCSSDETVECIIVSPPKDTVENEANEISACKECKCDAEVSTTDQHSLSSTSQSTSSLECICDEEVATSCRHSLSNTSQSLSKAINADIQEAEEVLGRKIFGNKLSITPSKSLEKFHTSAVVSPSDEKQPNSKPSVGLAVSNVVNLMGHEASSPLRKSLTTPVKIKSAVKSKLPSSKKKTPLRYQESVISDDDSSDTSSSESSSDSDSNSSSSSSSSSEEGTPVKENVSPEKQPTPLKSRARRSSDKVQPKTDVAASPNALEQVSSAKSPQAEIAIAMSEVVGSSEQVPQEAATEASHVNHELKSLIETKDMGTCQRIASSRNAHSAKSDIITEMEEKRRRMSDIITEMEEKRRRMSDRITEVEEKRRRRLEVLRSYSSGRCVSKKSKDKLLNPFAMQNKLESMKSGIVSGRKQFEIPDKQKTKEPDSSTKAPKQRRSKSDSEKPVNEPESHTKRRSASDCTTNPHPAEEHSDEDEAYKLHLDEEDDKDQPSPETLTQPLEVAEKQIAAMHEYALSPIKTVHEQPVLISTQKEVDGGGKEDQMSKAPDEKPLEIDSQKIVDESRQADQLSKESPIVMSPHEKSLIIRTQEIADGIEKEDQLSKAVSVATPTHKKPSVVGTQEPADEIRNEDQLSKAVSIVKSTHEEPLVTGTQEVVNEKEVKLSEAPKVLVRGATIVKTKVSGQAAADEVLKSLLEKGFGCPLPPPPAEKIRKVPISVEKATSEKKDDKMVSNKEKSDKKIESDTRQPNKSKTTAENSDKKIASTEKSNKNVGSATEKPDRKTGKPKDIVNQSKTSSSIGNTLSDDTEEQHFDGDDEEEACFEKINTSVGNSVELKLTYKGLGHFLPKQDVCVSKSLRFMMGDGQPLCLASTGFFSLFEKAPSKQTPKSESAEKQGQKSVSRKVDRTSKSDSRRRTSGHRDGDNLVKTTWDAGSSRHQDSRSRRNRSPSPRYKRPSYRYNDRGPVRDTHGSQDYNPRRDSYSRRHEVHPSHHRRSSESESRPGESSSSRLKLVEREEAEEGEIVTSDSSDFEVKINKKRRKASSPPHMRPVKRSTRESTTTVEKGLKETETKKIHSSPLKVKRTTRRVSQSVAKVSMVLTESSEKERRTKRKSTVEKQSLKVSAATEGKLGKDLQPEDSEDVDLDDDSSFPVLGDDNADVNETNAQEKIHPNSSNENNQSGMVTRRRAPPRSVNAHKVSSVETGTPIQKGKRKLSTSPDVASEDSCHSVLSSTNREGQQVRSSIMAASSSTAPAAKISKPNNKGEKVAETEIIKNLDVESFLSKLHG